MRKIVVMTFAAAIAASALHVSVQAQAPAAPAQVAAPDDPIRTLVSRLDLAKYKDTIKGLTRFGDRRQGTDRNKAAVDWIEAQLKSYGCTNTERVKYDFQPPPPRPPAAAGAGRGGRGGGTPQKGLRGPTGANNDPMKQPDEKVRALDSQPTTPGAREEVFCTKIGTTRPNEMVIVAGHMDGIGYAEAANDDGSGTALVMELARVFSAPGVQTDASIRFILWNNEETGLNGAHAYVDQRRELQGKEEPAGSGKYPEPKWLAMIQHDMMLWDHGMPLADGKLPPEQRPEADVNVEFAGVSKMAKESADLAWTMRAVNDRYATDYPVTVGNRMSNTDSQPFQDFTPTVSLRELERLSQVGSGWDPNWHQPTDMFATYSDKDFKLGLNAAQTTMATVAQIVGLKVK